MSPIGETVAAKQEVLVVNWKTKGDKKRKPDPATATIRWLRLKEENVKTGFKETIMFWTT